MSRTSGVPSLEALEAILWNDAVYEIAAALPTTDPTAGGRPRLYPNWLYVVFAALVAHHRSARRAATELGNPRVWQLVRQIAAERDASAVLPEKPITRHHWTYFKSRYLLDDQQFAALAAAFEETAADQALNELGLCDPRGPGSWTHPDLSRLVYADGKVVTPLYRAKRSEVRIDPETGEILQRVDPDATMHTIGSGEPAYGNKYVIMATRGELPHARIILGFDSVRPKQAEGDVFLELLDRAKGRLPGTQGLVYDGACRGKHIQRMLHEIGVLPIVPVTAASGGRAAKKPRIEKESPLGRAVATRPDGSTHELHVHLRAGAPGALVLDANGDPQFWELRRSRTYFDRNSDGTQRWYNDYAVPDAAGGGRVRLRLDLTSGDRRRNFNRPENLRPIPPSDPDYGRLYPRRSDAESINRHYVDTLWLGRAHSVGARGGRVDLLGFGLLVNSIAIWRHGRSRRGLGQQVA